MSCGGGANGSPCAFGLAKPTRFESLVDRLVSAGDPAPGGQGAGGDGAPQGPRARDGPSGPQRLLLEPPLPREYGGAVLPAALMVVGPSDRTDGGRGMRRLRRGLRHRPPRLRPRAGGHRRTASGSRVLGRGGHGVTQVAARAPRGEDSRSVATVVHLGGPPGGAGDHPDRSGGSGAGRPGSSRRGPCAGGTEQRRGPPSREIGCRGDAGRRPGSHRRPPRRSRGEAFRRSKRRGKGLLGRPLGIRSRSRARRSGQRRRGAIPRRLPQVAGQPEEHQRRPLAGDADPGEGRWIRARVGRRLGRALRRAGHAPPGQG